MSKEEGRKIGIKFTQPLVGDVAGNKSAFTISGKEYQWVDGPDYNGVLIDKEYAIDNIASHPTEVNAVLITMASQSWFRNAIGNITISYDMSKGTLSGSGGYVESFEVEFGPEHLVPKPNFGTHEKFDITASARINFVKIQYHNRYNEENFVITANATIDFIYVGIINP